MLYDQRSKLNDEFNEACKFIEPKILEKKIPLLNQRKQIIAGQLESYGDLTDQFDIKHEQFKAIDAAIVKPPNKESLKENPV